MQSFLRQFIPSSPAPPILLSLGEGNIYKDELGDNFVGGAPSLKSVRLRCVGLYHLSGQ
jgi:hypothetical protein